MFTRRVFLGYGLVVFTAATLSCRRTSREENRNTAAQPGSTNAPSRLPDNVPGRFYVNNSCIDCDLCREAAPAIFRRNEKDGYAFVFKQPASDAELRLCLQAVEGCPVEAIIDGTKL